MGVEDISTLTSDKLDEFTPKIESALRKLNNLKVAEINLESYKQLKTDIEKEKQLVNFKLLQIRSCLDLLVDLANKRNINYHRSIKKYNSQRIADVVKKCLSLGNFVLNEGYKEKLNYDILILCIDCVTA